MMLTRFIHIAVLAYAIVAMVCAPVISEPEFKCEFSSKLSMYAEVNDNIYYSSSSPDRDTIYREVFGVEVDCDTYSKIDFSGEFEFEVNDFRSFDDEDYNDEKYEFQFRRKFTNEDWLEFNAERDGVYIDSSEIAAYETAGNDEDWEFRYGRDLDKKQSLELYWGRERTNYALYQTSNSKTRGWGIDYSYDLGNYTYLEIEYNREKEKYYNDYQYTDLLDVSGTVEREDSSRTFSVAMSKTISIYPLKYVEVTAEKSRVSSNGTEVMYTNDGGSYLINGYDSYDNTNYSLYYMQDLNIRTMLSLYILYDDTDYPNFPVTDDYDRNIGQLGTKLKYYYLALDYTFNKKYSMDFSYVLADYDSNYRYLVYTQKVYTLGVTRKF